MSYELSKLSLPGVKLSTAPSAFGDSLYPSFIGLARPEKNCKLPLIGVLIRRIRKIRRQIINKGKRLRWSMRLHKRLGW